MVGGYVCYKPGLSGVSSIFLYKSYVRPNQSLTAEYGGRKGRAALLAARTAGELRQDHATDFTGAQGCTARQLEDGIVYPSRFLHFRRKTRQKISDLFDRTIISNLFDPGSGSVSEHCRAEKANVGNQLRTADQLKTFRDKRDLLRKNTETINFNREISCSDRSKDDRRRYNGNGA